MARKTHRKAPKRAGRPADRLIDDLRRHRMARDAAPDVAESLQGFLVVFPRIAARRRMQRAGMLRALTAELAAWAALGAPGDDPASVERLFAAGCVDLDPHSFPWEAVHASDAQDHVLAGLARASRALRAGVPDAADDAEAEAALAGVVDDVRALAEALAGGTATHTDGHRVATRAALAQVAAMGGAAELADDVTGPHISAQLFLLDGRVAAAGENAAEEAADMLDLVAEQTPEAIEHVRAHAVGEIDHEHGHAHELEPGQEDDEAEAEAEAGEPTLARRLDELDSALGMTVEADRGAEVAWLAGQALLAHALEVSESAALDRPLTRRVLSALAATRPDDVREAFDVSGEDGEGGPAEVGARLRDAAALTEASLAPRTPGPTQPEDALSRLDAAIGELRDLVAEAELAEALPATAHVLASAATEVLAAGLDLVGADDDTAAGMAATLACLDPLALAERPALRATAATYLEAAAVALEREDA
jgi:hypothetical protein